MAKRARFWDEVSQEFTDIDIWQGTTFTVTRDGSNDIATYTETWDDVTETITETATPTFHADGYVTSILFDNVTSPVTTTITRDSEGRITGGTTA